MASVRQISKSTAGAMRNANAMYKGGSAIKAGHGGQNAAYVAASSKASLAGKSGMAAHKAGMKAAGLSEPLV
jgi:hypothetical protein